MRVGVSLGGHFTITSINMSVDAGEVAEEYRSSLRDLVNNSKPLITMLTMLAEENHAHASVIVKVIEEHIHEVRFMYFFNSFIHWFIYHYFNYILCEDES